VGPLLGADHGNLLRGAGAERGSRVEAPQAVKVVNLTAWALAARLGLDVEDRLELVAFAGLLDALSDRDVHGMMTRALEILQEAEEPARLTIAQASLAKTVLFERLLLQFPVGKRSELLRRRLLHRRRGGAVA